MEYLSGREIHGFNTRADFDIQRLLDDASRRWLRPNEVHAVLSNHTLFTVQPQPVDLPPSGGLFLFDRKMLRNFRKDGHNWRKKKDGKTVQEAHEKLKIGNEERIHVYYARNEDDPNFYRRCYWLLDRDLERIVLVHYRQTAEESTNQPPPAIVEPKEAFHSTSSPGRSVNSTNASNRSEMSSRVAEDVNSGTDHTTDAGFHVSLIDKLTECGNHMLNLDELEGFCWKDIMEEPSYIGNTTSSGQEMVNQLAGSNNHDTLLHGISIDHPNNMLRDSEFIGVKQQGNDHLQTIENQKIDPQFRMGNAVNQVVNNDLMASLAGNETINAVDDVLQTQNSFEKWDYALDESHNLLNNQLQIQTSESQMPNELPVTIQSFYQEQIFSIVDISPAHACHTEETKIIVVGYFHDSYKHLEGSNLFCVFGDICVPAGFLQAGVYHTTALPHVPGSVSLYLTLDGHSPISQVIDFQYRSVVASTTESGVSFREVDNAVPKQKEFGILIRLAHLLFTTTNSLSVLSNRISPNSMKDAKKFESLTKVFLENQWKHFLEVNKNDESSFSTVSHDLFELLLKNKLQEWLLLRVAEGCKATTRDSQGQGVIHLCAMLDYSWAIKLFSRTSLSLDFRDACGWTPLHWAAYYGREKTIAALLSAGANPSLVADPSPDFPGGCTPADLASQEGFEGLGAYLAEEGLRAHFHAMSLSGNIVSPPLPSSVDPISSENIDSANLSEQELCLKDSLAAYRNAADAADRIQTAFRERSLKQQIKAAQLAKSETEAAGMVAALKIQKAFRNHTRRKMMKAIARIQGTFRTWQARKNFLNMRRQAIKIQSIFRAHRERRQYQQLVWSVGVLEKAVLRWRLKRRGLRGLQAESANNDWEMEEENCVEEDFYRASREQAEDRVKRSVVRVQAMFRSYQAQQEYRRMKLAYNEAKLEFNEFGDPSGSL